MSKLKDRKASKGCDHYKIDILGLRLLFPIMYSIWIHLLVHLSSCWFTGLMAWLWSFEPLVVYLDWPHTYIVEQGCGKPFRTYLYVFPFCNQVRGSRYIPTQAANHFFSRLKVLYSLYYLFYLTILLPSSKREYRFISMIAKQ